MYEKWKEDNMWALFVPVNQKKDVRKKASVQMGKKYTAGEAAANHRCAIHAYDCVWLLRRNTASRNVPKLIRLSHLHDISDEHSMQKVAQLLLNLNSTLIYCSS